MQTKTTAEPGDSVLTGAALQQRSWDAWNAAWERAAERDRKQGRHYDRHSYARLAHVARRKVLGMCERPGCSECKPPVVLTPKEG